MKRFLAIITITSFLIFTTLFPIPQTVSAATGIPFGGYDLWEFPCTCTAGALFFHLFVPLFFNELPVEGVLAAPSAPVAFSVYYLHPESWALGIELPGGGTGCLVGVEPYCVPVPNLGLIEPFTGVSPTGAP